MIKVIAGLLLVVTILLQLKYLEGGRAIDHKGVTLQETLFTGKKDLRREPSSAGTVGKCVIAMTTFAPGAEAFKIKV